MPLPVIAFVFVTMSSLAVRPLPAVTAPALTALPIVMMPAPLARKMPPAPVAEPRRRMPVDALVAVPTVIVVEAVFVPATMSVLRSVVAAFAAVAVVAPALRRTFAAALLAKVVPLAANAAYPV